MNSTPQIPGPAGWAKHDETVAVECHRQRAATTRLTIKLLAFIVIGCLLAGAWFFRWQITPVQHGDGLGVAYMLNRWTGEHYVLRFEQKMEVKLEK